MTRTISLIIGIATAALVVGVPTAFGEGRLAGSPEQDGVAFFYANERATLADQQLGPVVSRPDSHEVNRALGYLDAAERAERAASMQGRETVLLSGDDPVRIAPEDTPSPTVTSGSDIEWPQIGIGFGIGLVLALGLYLAMRFTRIRQPAH
jgi:hypothetical protein